MMPAWMLRASCVIALAMTIVGCKSTRDKPEVVEGSETSEEGPTYLIGMIELVNPEQKFVLIRV